MKMHFVNVFFLRQKNPEVYLVEFLMEGGRAYLKCRLTAFVYAYAKNNRSSTDCIMAHINRAETHLSI